MYDMPSFQLAIMVNFHSCYGRMRLGRESSSEPTIQNVYQKKKPTIQNICHVSEAAQILILQNQYLFTFCFT